LLEGQNAVVTGGASGIGAATCRRMAAEGARVAVLDTDLDGATVVADEIDGLALLADVSDSAALDEAIRRADEELGGLTLLFNNAGVGSINHLHGYDDDAWEQLLAVNLRGVFNGIRIAAPLMRAAGGGAIVNMASVSGVRPTRGEAPYSAAKAGVIALTKSAALEYAPSVRVNCVSPGLIETPLTALALSDEQLRPGIEAGTPLARVGTVDDVAGVVTFLCSDLSAYVTGENILVDGGSTLPSKQVDEMLGAMLDLFAPSRASSDE
jgi:NAD(P)-dependent dehydrogenase (short-subunit alcohol dehydrogenase family)